MTDYIAQNSKKQGVNQYAKLYNKFQTLKRDDLHVIERLLRSFANGKVDPTDQQYFDSVTMNEVNGNFEIL